MVIQHGLLNGFLPSILIICHCHHALGILFFQYGMKIAQELAALIYLTSLLFYPQTGKTRLPLTLFDFFEN